MKTDLPSKVREDSKTSDWLMTWIVQKSHRSGKFLES